MDPIFGLVALFLGSYMSSYGSSYMPPPADDVLGYYYYDNGSLLRVKKNTNVFDNSKKRRNYFPFAFGNTKTNIYSSPLQSAEKVYEYSIVCVAAYLCLSKDNVIYHRSALVTEVNLEHLSIISYVNIFKFIYLGIPEYSLPETSKKNID